MKSSSGVEESSLSLVGGLPPQAVILAPAESTEAPSKSNPALVYLASLQSEVSRATQARKLRGVLDRLKAAGFASSSATVSDYPWQSVSYETALAVLSRMVEEKLAPATIQTTRAALLGVFKQAWVLGQISERAYRTARELPRARGQRELAGRNIESEELDKLSEELDKLSEEKPALAARDRALLALLLVSGMRRSEVSKLRLQDWSPAMGALLVQGKGNKQRTVYVGGARHVVEEWLSLRGSAPGPLLLSAHKSGKLLPRGISPSCVFQVLRRLYKAAGLERLSPHDFRRTFATERFREKVPGQTIMRILGHSKMDTTLRYNREGDERKREVAESIKVPF